MIKISDECSFVCRLFRSHIVQFRNRRRFPCMKQSQTCRSPFRTQLFLRTCDWHDNPSTIFHPKSHWDNTQEVFLLILHIYNDRAYISVLCVVTSSRVSMVSTKEIAIVMHPWIRNFLVSTRYRLFGYGREWWLRMGRKDWKWGIALLGYRHLKVGLIKCCPKDVWVAASYHPRTRFEVHVAMPCRGADRPREKSRQCMWRDDSEADHYWDLRGNIWDHFVRGWSASAMNSHSLFTRFTLFYLPSWLTYPRETSTTEGKVERCWWFKVT